MPSSTLRRKLDLPGLLAWALCAWALLGCSERTEGMALELGVMHHPGEGLDTVRYPAGAERGFITDQGYGVVLRRAHVVIGRVELQRCEQSMVTSVLRGVGTLLSPVSIAHAHGGSSPTVVAVPTVLDLLDEDRNTISLARMEPPPGSYCSAVVRVDVADADAVGAPADGSMLGHSARVEGVFVGPGDSDERAFQYHTELPDEVELPFVDARGEATAIELSGTSRVAELRIELGYYAMLDGIELTEPDELVDGFRVIRNLLTQARAVVADDGAAY
jgi:hypothetical protein